MIRHHPVQRRAPHPAARSRRKTRGNFHAPRSRNRMLRETETNLRRSFVGPSFARAVRASGIRPSPQALSAGGTARSVTVTVKPLRRAAIAAARPAGPPPTTKISVFTTAAAPVRSRTPDPLPQARAGAATGACGRTPLSRKVQLLKTESNVDYPAGHSQGFRPKTG